MNHKEKAEFLKESIRELYCVEGRSFSAIEKILQINRKVISDKIKEWDFEPAQVYHFKPSTEKHLNKERQKIASMLQNDETITKIAEETNFSRKTLVSIIFKVDPFLKACYEQWQNRKEQKVEKRREDSRLNYIINFPDDEVWKTILGFSLYEVSTFGRVRRYSETNKAYYVLTPTPNINNGRLYVSMVNDEGKTKNMNLARVVAQTFIPHSEEDNTVNHIDGVVTNNNIENLEWVTQSTNNQHAYDVLNRKVVTERRFIFSKIIYNDTYEFSTVAAFAKFLGKSETQTRRYLEDPDHYNMNIRFI